MSSETVSDPVQGNVDSVDSVAVCPRCHKDLSQPHISVAEDVIKEYTRCLLGQRPFSKTINLLDGTLQVTFEGMTAEQSELLKPLLVEADIDRAIDMKLLATLKSVRAVDKGMQTSVDTYMADYNTRKQYCKSVPADITEVFASLDAPMLGVLRRCALAFDMLCLSIRESIFDDHFYTGIGLL